MEEQRKQCLSLQGGVRIGSRKRRLGKARETLVDVGV